MSYLVPAGIFLTVLGLVGILWSVVAVISARRARLSDEALRARMQQIVPINIGALMLSMLGLGVVVVGAILT